MKEYIVAFDKWYADFYLSKDFVRVSQTKEQMHMYAMKKGGRIIAYMHIESLHDLLNARDVRAVYVYPTPLTLAASVRKGGLGEYKIVAVDGVKVLGGDE